MRTTLSGYYRNLQFDQNKVSRELFDVTKQISSGQKIQYAYDDTSTFVDVVRLDNEVTTLTQVKQNAQKALQVSTNTDTTMNDMTKIIEAIKVKLVASANETQTPESLNALAGELRGLEQNLFQLANTSIDGNYLFSGSMVNTKPIDINGNYLGNEGELKTFLGSGVDQTYNINGADLFLGDENDTQRKINLNVPLFNQTKLYPDVMIDGGVPRTEGVEEYITPNSTIRDLMGDNDNIIDDVNDRHLFYIRGVRHDGTAFKTTISLKDTDSVDSLLSKIGEAFGNSGGSSVVNVTLNKDGQIEIEDKLPGSSKIDLNMVASRGESYTPSLNATSVAPNSTQVTVPTAGLLNVNDTLLIDGRSYTVTAVGGGPAPETVTLDTAIPGTITNVEVFKSTGLDLENDIATGYMFNQFGVKIQEFNKSEFIEYSSTITQQRDLYDPRNYQLDADFFTKKGEPTEGASLAKNVFKSEVQSIGLSGTRSDGSPVPAGTTLDITSTTRLNDIVSFIETTYDLTNEVSVSFKDSKIVIRTSNENVPINIVLDAYSQPAGGGINVDGLATLSGISYDEGNFVVKDNKLTSNQPQIISGTNEYAKPESKLVDVSGAATLDSEVLEFVGNDIYGRSFSVQINLSNIGSSFDYTDNAGVTTTYPIYNAEFIDNDNNGVFTPGVDVGVQTPADSMTYKQLFDVMNMITTDTLPQDTNAVVGIDYDEYFTAIKDSEALGITEFTNDSTIRFSDNTRTNTLAHFKINDANASDFTAKASVLNFQNNSALTISDAKTNFFRQIDEAITAVELGRSRADGNSGDPRNVGIQNAIQSLDDLSEHLFNQHAVAGVHSQTLQVTEDRTDMLIITTKSLRSETLDVDFAEASLELKQLELNYQAMLSTVSRISQLSLVNYL